MGGKKNGGLVKLAKESFQVSLIEIFNFQNYLRKFKIALRLSQRRQTLCFATPPHSFGSKAFYALKCLSFIMRMSYLGGLLLARGT